jgi:hypothetical protein
MTAGTNHETLHIVRTSGERVTRITLESPDAIISYEIRDRDWRSFLAACGGDSPSEELFNRYFREVDRIPLFSDETL